MKLALLYCLILFSCSAVATENYCHDQETNDYWDDIASRAVNNSDVMGLYKLRKKLCGQVDKGEMSVEEATEIFENERSRVVEKLQQEKNYNHTDKLI